MPDVRLINVTKRFGKIIAVDHVSLGVSDREYVTLLGPSGCGKTTTLRLIAGLAQPDEGEIYIGDKLVTWFPPEDREVGFVFQNYAYRQTGRGILVSDAGPGNIILDNDFSNNDMGGISHRNTEGTWIHYCPN